MECCEGSESGLQGPKFLSEKPLNIAEAAHRDGLRGRFTLIIYPHRLSAEGEPIASRLLLHELPEIRMKLPPPMGCPDDILGRIDR